MKYFTVYHCLVKDVTQLWVTLKWPAAVWWLCVIVISQLPTSDLGEIRNAFRMNQTVKESGIHNS